MYKAFRFGGFLLKIIICQWEYFFENINCRFFCMIHPSKHLLGKILPPHRFIEEPHSSKDADELPAGAEVVKRDLLNGEGGLQVRQTEVWVRPMESFQTKRKGSDCYLPFLPVEGHGGEYAQVCQVEEEVHQE